jgi:hypothetical protein
MSKRHMSSFYESAQAYMPNAAALVADAATPDFHPIGKSPYQTVAPTCRLRRPRANKPTEAVALSARPTRGGEHRREHRPDSDCASQCCQRFFSGVHQHRVEG